MLQGGVLNLPNEICLSVECSCGILDYSLLVLMNLSSSFRVGAPACPPF